MADYGVYTDDRIKLSIFPQTVCVGLDKERKKGLLLLLLLLLNRIMCLILKVSFENGSELQRKLKKMKWTGMHSHRVK